MSGSYNLDDALFGGRKEEGEEAEKPIHRSGLRPFGKEVKSSREGSLGTGRPSPSLPNNSGLRSSHEAEVQMSATEEAEASKVDVMPPPSMQQRQSAPPRDTGQPRATTVPSFSSEGRIIDNILRQAVADKASDIHLSINSKPLYRLDGDLQEIPGFDEVITSAWIDKALSGIMNETQYDEFKSSFEKDMSYTIKNLSRFRVNAFHQRGSAASVFRVIPDKVMTLEELNVPPVIMEISKKPRGLVLVTGPTGSGKSTTLAAMIDGINKSRPDHIVTIEDPIEFVHQNHRSLVNQREIGADTKNFAEALKRVLRQDPDVILVGELRDPETISVALTAAETGHLVFGTLHTQSAAKTINRVIDSFPAHQQNQVRAQLSDTLQAVISQALLKRKGGGRMMATEIMVRNAAIANQIREGKISGIYSSLQSGSEYGMHTLDQDLVRLVSQGVVERHHALALMEYPEALDSVSTPNPNEEW